tara:strand:- start:844 stop:1293 length:450 start_codon:yes stop_codon:yes gene_type:complete
MILGILMSNKVKIAVLESQVERLLDKQKELTERVRANEKVVAAIGLLGSIALAFIGAGYFAPKAEAYPEYLEPRTQVIPGSLPESASMANQWIDKIREWEWEQKKKDPSFDINNALAEYFNGSDDPTEQEELLQLQSDKSGQSIGWRYD